MSECNSQRLSGLVVLSKFVQSSKPKKIKNKKKKIQKEKRKRKKSNHLMQGSSNNFPDFLMNRVAKIGWYWTSN